MMRTVDRVDIAVPLEAAFQAAADVERWPEFLGHYRWVKMLKPTPDGGEVEMAAWRPFGPIRYPTWWASNMWIDRQRREVRYRHIRGITRGMDVVWRLAGTPTGTRIDLVHEWDGPPWPLIRRPAAEWVIGPVFVHGIASRTLAGLKRHLERNA
jgi:ribosome-associated toxin RatA of RatAB toxin-antitoxin module